MTEGKGGIKRVEFVYKCIFLSTCVIRGGLRIDWVHSPGTARTVPAVRTVSLISSLDAG